MSRTKKNQEIKKKTKKTKKSKNEEVSLDDEEDLIEEHPEEQKKSKPKKKTDEDELSDIDVTDENVPPVETAEHDAIVANSTQTVSPRAEIGTLKTEDILKFLIQRGKDELNPHLKNGTQRLLNELQRGRRQRYYPNHGGGSKRGNAGFNPLPSYRANNGRGMSMNMGVPQKNIQRYQEYNYRHPTSADLYDDGGER